MLTTASSSRAFFKFSEHQVVTMSYVLNDIMNQER